MRNGSTPGTPNRNFDTNDIAGTGTIRDTAGTIPDRVSFVLLEWNGPAIGIGAGRNSRDAGNELWRLETDSHLVAIVLTLDGSPVHPHPTCTRKIVPRSAI